MAKHRAAHHARHTTEKKSQNLKWMWIAGGLIVVLALSFLILSSSPKSEVKTNNSQPSVEEKSKYSILDCSVLNIEDVQSVFGTQEVTQEKYNVDQNMCSKGWKTWKVDGASRTPGNTISLIISNTSALANYDYQTPVPTLDRVCGKYPSINLGDYKSCNLFGEIYFGKGSELIQLQCVNCPDGNGLKLANLLASRI